MTIRSFMCAMSILVCAPALGADSEPTPFSRVSLDAQLWTIDQKDVEEFADYYCDKKKNDARLKAIVKTALIGGLVGGGVWLVYLGGRWGWRKWTKQKEADDEDLKPLEDPFIVSRGEGVNAYNYVRLNCKPSDGFWRSNIKGIAAFLITSVGVACCQSVIGFANIPLYRRYLGTIKEQRDRIFGSIEYSVEQMTLQREKLEVFEYHRDHFIQDCVEEMIPFIVEYIGLYKAIVQSLAPKKRSKKLLAAPDYLTNLAITELNAIRENLEQLKLDPEASLPVNRIKHSVELLHNEIVISHTDVLLVAESL